MIFRKVITIILQEANIQDYHKKYRGLVSQNGVHPHRMLIIEKNLAKESKLRKINKKIEIKNSIHPQTRRRKRNLHKRKRKESNLHLRQIRIHLKIYHQIQRKNQSLNKRKRKKRNNKKSIYLNWNLCLTLNLAHLVLISFLKLQSLLNQAMN